MTIFLDITKKIIPAEKVTNINSIWFWIALVEFLLIIILLYIIKSKKKVSELSDIDKKNIKNSKNNTIDMENLVNSIHNSRTLYKELSKKCHPDRFINDSKQEIAEDIFQEITKNERNFKKLSELKSRAINELNIKF